MSQGLYSQTGYTLSRLLTEQYSTSFSQSVQRLHPSIRNHIYAIYIVVRLADEIVDTFQNSIDAQDHLERFKHDVMSSIKERYSRHPKLNAFQLTVHKFNIDQKLITAFFHSMRMDLTYKEFSHKDYKTYIYGSAEVVGLMSLAIFCEGDQTLYHQLVPGAKSLGSAFQKINFLRDINSDYIDRNRTYFPNTKPGRLLEREKKEIEAEISQEFAQAQTYIENVPIKARRAVKLAYLFYSELLNEIQKVPANELFKRRVSVPVWKKLFLVIRAWF